MTLWVGDHSHTEELVFFSEGNVAKKIMEYLQLALVNKRLTRKG
jgi:hypothetical protein